MAERWEPQLISIIMPTRDRSDILARTLTALNEQTVPPDRFEVIVIDDAGSDDTPAMIEGLRASLGYRLTLLRQSTQSGPAATRNTGLRQARGDLILFLDSDCIAEPSLLAEHLASHSVEGLAVIGRTVWHPEITPTEFVRFVEAFMYFNYWNISIPVDATFVCFYTANASVHRGCLDRVGGFDEQFNVSYEDIDLAYRLRQIGVRFIFNERARALHYVPVEFQASLERARRMGQGIMRFWAKHPELHQFVPTEQLIDPALRRQFYRVTADYYFALGMNDVLTGAHSPGLAEQLRPDFETIRRRWTDEQLDRLDAEHQRLQAEIERLRPIERWANELAAEHSRLEHAYVEQSRWAGELATQLSERGLLGRLRRLIGRRQPASPPVASGLDSLLALRQADRSAAPDVARSGDG